jgi:F0F1-type ATP synthase membrane subunit b/b'
VATGADRPGGDRPRIARVLARASTSTWNLVVAGAGAVAAAATHSWAILAISGAAYAAMVGLEAVNPRTWGKSAEPGPRRLTSRARVQLPDESALVDPSTRAAVAALRAAARDRQRVLAETPPTVTAHLSEVIGSLAELDARAASLVSRAEDLARFLATANIDAVRQELVRLERRITSAADPATRSQLESAREARREHLRALEEIAAAKTRVDATLDRMVATLSALPAKLMRMRALDDQAMDDLGGDLGEELDRMNTDLRAFEETLRTLTEAVPS